MNYEILSSRWSCPECSSGVRLLFAKSGSTDDEGSDEFVCGRVLCEAGHELPEDLTRDVIEMADQEFYAAMERGYKISEIWMAPESQEEPPA